MSKAVLREMMVDERYSALSFYGTALFVGGCLAVGFGVLVSLAAMAAGGPLASVIGLVFGGIIALPFFVGAEATKAFRSLVIRTEDATRLAEIQTQLLREIAARQADDGAKQDELRGLITEQCQYLSDLASRG